MNKITWYTLYSFYDKIKNDYRFQHGNEYNMDLLKYLIKYDGEKIIEYFRNKDFKTFRRYMDDIRHKIIYTNDASKEEKCLYDFLKYNERRILGKE